MKSRNQSQCAIPCNTQGSPAYSPPIFSNGSLSDIEAPNLGFCLEVSANFFFGGWHSKSSMMSSSNFIALAFFTIHPTYLSKIPDLTQTLEVLLGNFDSIITMGMTSSRPHRKIPMHYVYLFHKKKRILGDVWLFTQHVFFSVQGSKSASLQKLNKASQIERICQMLKGRTTVSQTNMATKNTPPEV